MKAYIGRALTALVGIMLAIGVAGSASAAQSLKRQMVGTWTFASVDIVAKDGSHIQPYGANPSGVIIFERNGHFAVVLTRPDLPKYASNDRLMGTAEEYKATVQGVLAYAGTYSVNEADHSCTMHIESSSFPNWVGTTQTRAITKLTRTELSFTNSTPSSGATANVALKRAK